MFDSSNILELMKRCTLETIETNQPCDFCYGKVTSKDPLKILVDQKMELSIAQLVLTRNVSDFNITVSIDNLSTDLESGDSGEASFAAHSHSINVQKRKVTVHNGLELGDNVVLIRKQGGQQYLVMDRVVNV